MNINIVGKYLKHTNSTNIIYEVDEEEYDELLKQLGQMTMKSGCPLRRVDILPYWQFTTTNGLTKFYIRVKPLPHESHQKNITTVGASFYQTQDRNPKTGICLRQISEF